MFGSAKPRRALILGALVGLGGCLTPEMGREIDESLGLSPKIIEFHETRTVFDSDRALPTRIWYCDAVARIYHERRTNTFLAFDAVHKGWGAIPEREAFERGFRPARAKLLSEGPPSEVKSVVDYLTEMEPGWRGS